MPRASDGKDSAPALLGCDLWPDSGKDSASARPDLESLPNSGKDPAPGRAGPESFPRTVLRIRSQLGCRATCAGVGLDGRAGAWGLFAAGCGPEDSARVPSESEPLEDDSSRPIETLTTIKTGTAWRRQRTATLTIPSSTSARTRPATASIRIARSRTLVRASREIPIGRSTAAGRRPRCGRSSRSRRG